MNSGLIQKWNDVVAEDDVVYVLGDVSFYDVARTIDLLTRLNGTRILIRGNHDQIKSLEKAQRFGYSEFHTRLDLTLINGESVILSHYPFGKTSDVDDRFAERRPLDDGRFVIHGHVHETWSKRGRQINVGVDVRNYAPMSEAELILEMQKTIDY